MSYHFKQSGHLGILIFNDEITLKRESELKEALMISLDNVEHLMIYFEKLKDINDSFIHLLCSSYRYCNRASKRLTLIGSQNKKLRQMIHNSDLIDIPKCIDDCFNKCLWA
jgi:anti-anti-sigma regulatory factor